MTTDDDFARYLSEPCSVEGCDRRATHNAQPGAERLLSEVDGRSPSPGGAVCNTHLPRDSWARARND